MDEIEKKPMTQMEVQIELERLFSKNQAIPRIKAEFKLCKELDFLEHMKSERIPSEFGFDLLAQMVLHKRANIETMIGLLYHHMESAQATADMLIRCAEAELVDYDTRSKTFIVKFDVTQDVQDDLDRFQFPLPMVIRPRRIKHNRQNGYMTTQSSVILKNNHHEKDVCLDHLNQMNEIRLVINQDVVTMIKNKWKSLDKPKEGETRNDFLRRQKAFAKYDRTAKDVMKILTDANDHFYLTHRYDKRGRVYCMGYHVTYQGNPWNKACIQFAEKELVE